MFRENLKYSGSTFVKCIIASIMCLFVYISIQFIAVAVYTQEIGYTIYEVVDNQRGEALYTHYFADGEDLKIKEYEGKDIKVEKISVRSTLTDKQSRNADIIAQVFCFCIIGAILYGRIWSIGTADNNKVKFSRMEEDKLRGLKIGSIATIPSVIVYLLLILARLGVAPNILFSVYKLCNVHIFGYLNVLFGSKTLVADLPVYKIAIAALPLVFVPLLCAVAYILGYKDISLSEKIIYKRKRG